MTPIKTRRVTNIPSRRSTSSEYAQKVEEFFTSEDKTPMMVEPDVMAKDEEGRKKQVASAYNTLKYHIKKRDLESVIRVRVSNWKVYLEWVTTTDSE